MYSSRQPARRRQRSRTCVHGTLPRAIALRCVHGMRYSRNLARCTRRGNLTHVGDGGRIVPSRNRVHHNMLSCGTPKTTRDVFVAATCTTSPRRTRVGSAQLRFGTSLREVRSATLKPRLRCVRPLRAAKHAPQYAAYCRVLGQNLTYHNTIERRNNAIYATN